MFLIYFFVICFVFVLFLVFLLFVVIYFLDRVNGVCDISFCRCLMGWCFNVVYVLGLDGWKDGVMWFFGKVNSYIEIFNNGKLDIVVFISVFMWVYYEGFKGFVVNYRFGFGWGVYIWMMGLCMFFVRFVCRDGVFMKLVVVISRKICYRVWNYFSVIYDYKIGVVKLWVNLRLLVV